MKRPVAHSAQNGFDAICPANTIGFLVKPKTKAYLLDAFAVALLFGGYAVHGLTSDLFLISGSFCVWYGAYITLLNQKVHGVTKATAQLWSFLLFAVSVIAAFAYWRENSEPNAPEEKRFTLSVFTESPAGNALTLTNDFLFTRMKEDGFRLPTNMAFLKVNVAGTEPEFSLRFDVRNEGPATFSSSKSDIEKASIQIWILPSGYDDVLDWSADPAWERSAPVEADASAQVLFYQFPRPLSPGAGDSSPTIRFNMEEKLSTLVLGIVLRGEDVKPTVCFFKLVAIPSTNANTIISLDTNDILDWKPAYRPVSYHPIDSPIVVSPPRVHLSDGDKLIGTVVTVSNPTTNDLYAISMSVESESRAVSIGSLEIELSNPNFKPDQDHVVLHQIREAQIGLRIEREMKFYTIPVLPAKESRTIWIRGTLRTNSYANVSIWQSLRSMPEVSFTTNGARMWTIIPSNSPFWTHAGVKSSGFELSMAIDSETNGSNDNIELVPRNK